MLRRIGAWILRRLGLVCTLGSRGFPDQWEWDPTIQRDQRLLDATRRGECLFCEPGEKPNDRT